MVRLLFALSWFCVESNSPINSMDLVIVNGMLAQAKVSGLITPLMPAYYPLKSDELSKVSNRRALIEEDVDICDLPNLRAYISFQKLLTDVGIISATIEFNSLEAIVVYGKVPKLRKLPPYIREYVRRIEEKRISAENELKRAQRVVLLPADQLAHSPQFSPARLRNGGVMYLCAQSDDALVHTPNRSQAFIRFEHSPENTLQHTPLDRKILNTRREQEARLREQHALMSPLRKQATDAEMRAAEAERERNELAIAFSNNVGTVNQAHLESQRVLTLQEDCLCRHEQIMELTRFIRKDTTAMRGNFLYLRNLGDSLEICKSDLEKVLKTLQDLCVGLPGH